MDQFDFEEAPELNITPLVDIMLVLLAILMVTIPAVHYKEDIALPQGSKTRKLQQEATLEVRITKNKKIKVRNQTYNYKNFPDNFLLMTQKMDKQTPVYIFADKNLIYQDVIYILKVIKESGFSRASLVTQG